MTELREKASPRRKRTLVSDRCNDVLAALRRIIRATDLQSKSLFKKFGLTTPQIVVLLSVRELGEVTTGTVSNHVSLSQGTVTSILDRLEARGLIERYRSTIDRRVVHVRLTGEGRAILRTAPPLLHENFIETFSALDESRQSRIVETLESVAEMLGASELDAAPLLDITPDLSGITPRQRV